MEARRKIGSVFLCRYLTAPTLGFEMTQLVKLWVTIFLSVLAHRAVKKYDLRQRLHSNIAAKDKLGVLRELQSFLQIVCQQLSHVHFGAHNRLEGDRKSTRRNYSN